jgi:RNA polymerase sigma-70 factor (ECF subfamily)
MREPSPKEDEPSDWELITRWQAGDERAATELVARHAPALARFAAASGAGADAEELVQDTFVRAFGSLDSFRGESSLRTWLFTIERRLLLDRRRAARRRGTGVELAENHLTTSDDPLEAVVAGESRDRLRVAVSRLSPTQREVFMLRVGEGLSYKEIASTVGTTEGAARVHYHNAMRTIKEFLDD